MDKLTTLNIEVNPNVSINPDLMTKQELHEKLIKGYSDIESGKVQDAVQAFEKFREKH